jgi:hypothetical protein
MDPNTNKAALLHLLETSVFAMKSQHKFLISQTRTLQLLSEIVNYFVIMHTQTIAFYFMLKSKFKNTKNSDKNFIELFHVASFHILTLLLTYIMYIWKHLCKCQMDLPNEVAHYAWVLLLLSMLECALYSPILCPWSEKHCFPSMLQLQSGFCTILDIA